MNLIFKILIFIFLLCFVSCQQTSQCSQFDSSCSLVTSSILERLISNSRVALIYSPQGGTYKFDQFLTIATVKEKSVIRYTIDGSNPTCSYGTIFTTPIPLIGINTYTVKSVACNEIGVLSRKEDTYTITMSPLAAPNLRFWYSADSIGTENGMEVKEWRDYSGNANHLYPSSMSSSNPTLIANALNGKPSVRFNLTEKHFMNTKTMNSYTGTKAGTGIMVLRKYTSQANEVYFSIGTVGNNFNSRNWKGNLQNPSICSTLAPTANNCAGAASTSVPNSGYHIILFTMDSTGLVRYYYDGILSGSSTLTTPANFSTANTMFLGSGLNMFTFLDAEILETLFFEQNFDTNGINTAHCLMQDKYGLPVGTNCP